jgi:hypothetical protein
VAALGLRLEHPGIDEPREMAAGRRRGDAGLASQNAGR